MLPRLYPALEQFGLERFGEADSIAAAFAERMRARLPFRELSDIDKPRLRHSLRRAIGYKPARAFRFADFEFVARKLG
jgi:hypothetical protein